MLKNCFSDMLPTIAVSEYMRNYPEQIRRWVTGPFFCLGTDGFGRSDTRQNLRKFFEIDKDHIVYSSLIALNKLDEAISYLKENNIILNEDHPWQK